ncbi:MAG: hypothetical protein JWO61_184 [Candidatus Saccharibacteria bacterium]|nr:hypothetical protein [Candidatus Saccharibacteria bacterium]
MSAREVLNEVWKAGHEDAHETTSAQKALLGAAAAALVIEWTATEASLVAVGNAVFDNTHSPLLTALATGGTSFAEQAALGLVTVASINNFPSVFATVRAKREQQKQRKANKPSTSEVPLEVTAEDIQIPLPASEMEQPTRKRLELINRFGKQFGDAFGFGTSLNALIKNTSEEFSSEQNVKNVISDAGLIGLGVTALFGIGIEVLGEHATSEVLSSPFTYAGVISLMVGSRVIENIRQPRETGS